MQLHEPLEITFERINTRLLTYEEITHMSRSSRRMELGCAAAERLPAMEAGLLRKAMDAANKAAPNSSAELHAVLEPILLIVLRQSVLALAMDDYRSLTAAALELQQPHWDAALPAEATEAGFDALRDASLADFPKKEAEALDRFLRPVARFFIANGTVAQQAPAIIEGTVTKLFSRHRGIEQKFTDCRAFVEKDLERFLMHSARGILPGGEVHVFRSLQSIHETMCATPFGYEVMRDTLDYLQVACRKSLPPAPRLEFMHQLRAIADFTILSADLIDKRERIIAQATGELMSAHSERMEAIKDAEEFTRKDFWRVLEACAFATHKSGRKHFFERFYEFDDVLQKGQFGAKLMADAFCALESACAQHLGGRAMAVLEPVLREAVFFIAISADIAEHGEEITEHACDYLEHKFREQFEKFARQRAFMKWDQDQILWAVRFSILPGWEHHCSQMFDCFGHVISRSAFFDQPEMMRDFFQKFEELCRQRMTTRSLVRFLPRWAEYRSYLELFLSLAGCREQIIDTAAEEVMSRFREEVESYDGGLDVTKRDLRHMLHTSAMMLLPGGSESVTRGMEDFWDAIFHVAMNKQMLDGTFKALEKSAAKFLAPDQRPKLLPLLEAGSACAHVFADMAMHADPIVDGAVKQAFQKFPNHLRDFHGCTRKSREDMMMILHRCAMAVMPGGEDVLAWGMVNFGEAVTEARFDPALLAESLSLLVRDTKKALDKASWNSLLPILDSVLTSTEVFAELGQHEDAILNAAVDEVFRKFPAEESKIELAREKAEADLRLVLRYSAALGVPGVAQRFIRDARAFWQVLLKSRFHPAMMQFALGQLDAQAAKVLSRSARRTVSKYLKTIVDALTVMSGTASFQEEIIPGVVNDLMAKHSHTLQRVAGIKGHMASDLRLALEASMISFLPGGDAYREEFIKAMKVVVAHQEPYDKTAMLDAGNLLAQACASHLQDGNGRQAVSVINKTFQAFA